MCHLRMELNAKNFPLRIFHGRDCGFSACGNVEIRRRLQNAIAVTHPYATYPVKQRRWLHRFDLARSILTMTRRFHTAAEFLPDELHAVTNSEHRDVQLENTCITNGSVGFVNRGRPTAQDQTLRLHGLYFFQRSVEWHDFRVDVRLANSATDELCVLSTEIEDKNRFKLR